MKDSLTLRSLNYGDTFRFAHRDGMFRFLGLVEYDRVALFEDANAPSQWVHPPCGTTIAWVASKSQYMLSTHCTDAQVVRIARGPIMGEG